MRWQLSSQDGVIGGLVCSHVLEVPDGPRRSLAAPPKGGGSREAAGAVPLTPPHGLLRVSAGFWRRKSGTTNPLLSSKIRNEEKINRLKSL